MNTFKRKKRYNFMNYVLIILFSILSFQLFYLTVVKGNYYRNIADNIRIKDVQIPAARGNIYDRNGKLLAGTMPVFTLQILKDEFNREPLEKRNEVLLKLTRLLDEDGSSYYDENSFELYGFEYETKNEYLSEELSPEDKIIKILIDNNLMSKIISLEYKEQGTPYKLFVIKRALKAINSKGIYLPIEIVEKEGSINVNYKSNEEILDIKKKYLEFFNNDPLITISNFVQKDTTLIKKIINHPIVRKMVYEYLSQNKLTSNVVLKEYSSIDDVNHLLNKVKFMREFKDITFDSSAKEDFITIVKTSSLTELLSSVYFNENRLAIIPAELLIKKLDKAGIEHNLTYDLDQTNKDDPKVVVSYKVDQNDEKTPMEKLISLAAENNILDEFIVSEEIKSFAQKANTEKNINPKISTKYWEYTYLKNKRDNYKLLKLKDDASALDFFNAKKEKFKIGDMKNYEIFNILSLHDRIIKQGTLRYQPLNISYNISEMTVAKIKENIKNNIGFDIVVVPVRYYPDGDELAHVLGYIGKISQPFEIDEYINKRKYNPMALIGKTGLEESLETSLKGTDGIKKVETDNVGNRTKTLSENSAVPGNHVYSTIDKDLQKTTYESLKQTLEKLQTAGYFKSKLGDVEMKKNEILNRPYINATSGATVVTDVRTGEILAWVNYPSFNLNLFSTGITNSDWESLKPANERDPLAPRPLLNIAMQTAIQPGSTFKLASTLAALEKGLSPEKKVNCTGYVDIGDTRFGCWIWNIHKGAHGYENAYEALRDSCNYYYYILGLGKNINTNEDLGVKVDINDIINITRKLGFGQPTGVEIKSPKENKGDIPNPATKIALTKKYLNKFLITNLKKYSKADKNFTEDEIKAFSDKITSWIDEPETISRQEIIKRLDNLGFMPETVISDVNKKEGLADIIKFSYLKQVSWNITDTLNVLIGQGQSSYTVLQMVNYMSIFANGGYKNKLTLLKSIKNHKNEVVLFENKPEFEKIQLNNYENLNHIKKGLNMASKTGSLKEVFGKLKVEIGVKTGTAQRSGKNPVTGENFDDYSWMIAFAPYENPEIAITTVIFQGGSGSNAAPLTREIISRYFELKTERKNLNITN